MPKTSVNYTEEERAEVLRALKTLLVATAEFWDALRQVEHAHEVEIEYSDNMVGMLAGDLGTPPSFQDLTDKDVWETFLETSTVRG